MTDCHTAAASMKPGTYLQKRREAAGLTVDEMALRIAGPAGDAGQVRTEIEAIERDDLATLKPTRHWTLLDRLGEAFRFDQHVYYALVGLQASPALPAPLICRDCGCSWNDACVDHRGPCGWVDLAKDEPPLCSHCADAEIAQMGMVIAVADVTGDECPDCGGDLGPPFGSMNSRTCRSCDTTFLGAGEEDPCHAA